MKWKQIIVFRCRFVSSKTIVPLYKKKNISYMERALVQHCNIYLNNVAVQMQTHIVRKRPAFIKTYPRLRSCKQTMDKSDVSLTCQLGREILQLNSDIYLWLLWLAQKVLLKLRWGTGRDRLLIFRQYLLHSQQNKVKLQNSSLLLRQ